MNSTACRYYTERTVGWMLNNKIIVFLSLLSFCLFVSTLAMAGQRNRLAREVEDLSNAIENLKTTIAPTDAPTEAPATEALATETPATEAQATETPATEGQATETPATEGQATETQTTDKPTEGEDAPKPESDGKAFDVENENSVVSGYKDSRLLRRLGFVA